MCIQHSLMLFYVSVDPICPRPRNLVNTYKGNLGGERGEANNSNDNDNDNKVVAMIILVITVLLLQRVNNTY